MPHLSELIISKRISDNQTILIWQVAHTDRFMVKFLDLGSDNVSPWKVSAPILPSNSSKAPGMSKLLLAIRWQGNFDPVCHLYLHGPYVQFMWPQIDPEPCSIYLSLNKAILYTWTDSSEFPWSCFSGYGLYVGAQNTRTFLYGTSLNIWLLFLGWAHSFILRPWRVGPCAVCPWAHVLHRRLPFL